MLFSQSSNDPDAQFFTPWDQSMKKSNPNQNQFNTDSTQPSLSNNFTSPTKDVFDIMAERNFETILSYDGVQCPFPSPLPNMQQSHKLNLVQLEIIEEEKKDGVTGRDLQDDDNS